MRFSDRANSIRPTGVRRMFDLAGDDAIQFGLGEPDFFSFLQGPRIPSSHCPSSICPQKGGLASSTPPSHPDCPPSTKPLSPPKPLSLRPNEVIPPAGTTADWGRTRGCSGGRDGLLEGICADSGLRGWGTGAVLRTVFFARASGRPPGSSSASSMTEDAASRQ